MRALALPAIRFYQRRISPYKGFACAYRVHTGRASCSVLGYRAIRRFGLWRGLAILDARLHRCGVAHRRYGAATAPVRGSCDAPCDLPCGPDGDLPDLNCRNAARLADCCNGSCDWPRRRDRKDRRGQRGEHLPPRREVDAAT
jgi:putative component of membrane protein insertase Oxa1/YidC/SpoIIIJ protein YidD